MILLRRLLSVTRGHAPLLVAGVLATLAVVYALDVKLPPTYQASGTLLVLPPRNGGAITPVAGTDKPAPTRVVNPYLAFDASVYILARVAVQELSSDQARQAFLEGGDTASFQVTTSLDEPAITIVVTGTDSPTVLRTLKDVAATAQTDLARRQQATGVPEETWATLTPLLTTPQVSQTSGKLKTLGVALGLGLVAAVSLAFVAEALTPPGPRAPRRRRQREKAEPAPRVHPAGLQRAAARAARAVAAEGAEAG